MSLLLPSNPGRHAPAVSRCLTKTVEEEAVEMNSTAKRGKGGRIMVGKSYFIGGCLSKRKLVTCAAL
jgi:hypothetical protein